MDHLNDSFNTIMFFAQKPLEEIHIMKWNLVYQWIRTPCVLLNSTSLDAFERLPSLSFRR